MGVLTERLRRIEEQAGNLAPLAERARQVLFDGNKAIILDGETPAGKPVAPLKASTLRRRKGTGPPRAPRGAASRIISGYVVAASSAPGELTLTGGWPNFPQAAYLDAKRPLTGFRRVDLETTMNQLTEHVFK